MYMEKIRTTVRVAGKDYTIASYDPEAHVQRVAAYVDRKLNELSAATRLPQAQLSCWRRSTSPTTCSRRTTRSPACAAN